MLQRPLICSSCAHYDRYDIPEDPRAPRTCMSFPNGIPRGINPGGGDHRESRNGEPPWMLQPGYEPVLEIYEADKDGERD